MDLLDVLGSGTGLFRFPIDDVNRAMRSFQIKDFQTQNLVLANYAELVAFNASMAGEIGFPLDLPSGALPFAIYKTNTITYTCGYHHGEEQHRAEYAFLFTSDCWKLREILRGDPLDALIRDPLFVRSEMIRSGWQFVEGNERVQNVCRNLTLLLWRAKALLIVNPAMAQRELRSATMSMVQLFELPGRGSFPE